MVDVVAPESAAALEDESGPAGDFRPVSIHEHGSPDGGRLPRPVLSRHRLTGAAALAGLMVVAVALRVPMIGRAYWIDEGISVGIASHPLSRIPGLLKLDGSPPLFYVILHWWIGLFGASAAATHALPLTISVLIVPLAWWCTRSLFGDKPAWCAAVLAATNPFLNWYATETRMYSLVCALGMVGVTFAIRASRRQSRIDAVAAVAAFSALLYTHNWGIYLAGATTVVMLVRALIKRQYREVPLIVGGTVVVAVSYLPWLPALLFQARHTAAPWAVSPSLADLFADPASTLGGSFAAAVVPVLGVAALVNLRRAFRSETQPAIAAAAIGLLTMMGGWVLAQLEPSWTARYLAVPLGVMLIAIAGILGRNRFGRSVVGLAALSLVGWSIWGFLLPDANPAFAKSNVAAVDSEARHWLGPGDLVVVTQTEQVPVVAHYLPATVRFATPTGLVRDPRVVDWRDLVRRLARARPCEGLGAAMDSLPVGHHLMVVNPLTRLGTSGTVWARVVNRAIEAANGLVDRDPAFVSTVKFRLGVAPRPFSAVTAELFTKTANGQACSAVGTA